jgi:two-component system cell cycle sensor histidine kinase/response regulator CckA
MAVGETGLGREAAAGPAGEPVALVLIVDDEPAIRRFAARAVQQAGYAVAEAADGRSAIAIVEAEHARLALVVCDLSLPDVGGEEVLRAARGIRPDLGAIVMTGWDPGTVAEALGAAGTVELLPKPFTTAQLRAAIDAVAGR